MDYYTPDEIFYTNPGIYPENISFKFLITKVILTFIHGLNRYLLPVFNILILFLVIRYFYSNFISKAKTLSYHFILLIFLLPSVIYFSSAYLRDFYIYIASLLFFYSEKLKTRTVLVLIVLIGILRYEAGLVILLSVFIEWLIFRRGFIYFNRVIFYISIFFMWLFLFLLIQNDFLYNQFYELVSNYEKSTVGFSVFQLPVTKESILAYSIPNWFAYWMPFFFKSPKSLFDYFFLIDALVLLLLILRFALKYNATTFRSDKVYRIATLIFLATFFLALFESLPETMIRHHMAYLPALIYLNFNIKTKNQKSQKSQNS